MKIVVNRCKGSFSLSARAVARLAELNGQKAYFFADGAEITLEDTDSHSWRAFNTNSPTPRVPLERAPKDRTDPKLVQVVEELGSAASGKWAELKVIEIPDGIEWVIISNGGFETVHEILRSMDAEPSGWRDELCTDSPTQRLAEAGL